MSLHGIIGAGPPWNDANLIDIVCDGKVYYVPNMRTWERFAFSPDEVRFSRRVIDALARAYLG